MWKKDRKEERKKEGSMKEQKHTVNHWNQN